jgi:hypothetical protein
MAHAEIALGAIDLASTASGLQLHLESRAQLASSADHADGVYDRLTATALTTHIIEDLWITRGSDFKLIVSLDVSVDALDRGRLTRAFAHNLYHAEVGCNIRDA